MAIVWAMQVGGGGGKGREKGVGKKERTEKEDTG